MVQARESADAVSISVFLDDAAEPIATYKPPARFQLDTTMLADGEHVLRIQAVDAVGKVGVRRIPFTVANGPGITLTGLRAGSRVHGTLDIDVNAFSSDEPFDPVRAESAGPIPVWTWVMFAIVAAWAAWYGMEFFRTPASFAQTPTYAENPLFAQANAPGLQRSPPSPAAVSGNEAVGSKNIAGFDYSDMGARVYGANCQSCHGQGGTGLTGAFPPLAGDPIVNGANADAQATIVLRGLSGKVINGVRYSAQMPSFASQLSDPEIAAVIDHERTSWGNHGPVITPGQVARDR